MSTPDNNSNITLNLEIENEQCGKGGKGNKGDKDGSGKNAGKEIADKVAGKTYDTTDYAENEDGGDSEMADNTNQ